MTNIFGQPADNTVEEPTIVTNTTDLRSLSTFTANTIYRTLGYSALNDGGSGEFYWDSTSVATDNNIDIIKPTAITTGRFIFLKSRNILSVKEAGAKGDGATDDTLAVYDAVRRLITAGGGILDFPNPGGNTVYIVNYGFLFPYNIQVRLNGCTIKCGTTMSQVVTLPEYGARSLFQIGQATSGILGTIGKVQIIGDGAIIEGNRGSQIGTAAGYSLIVVQTSGVGSVPDQADFLKLQNIEASDITLRHSGFDSTYISGAQHVKFTNVRSEYGLRLGHVIVGGDDIVYDSCYSAYTIGDNASWNALYGYMGPGNSGAPVWHEPNETWQDITNVVYNNLHAEYNYQGVLLYNPGQDVKVSIEVNSLISNSNVYDSVTSSLRDSAGSGQVQIGLTDTGAKEFNIWINYPVISQGMNAGILIARGHTTSPDRLQHIVIRHPTIIECCQKSTDSINSAPITVGPTTGDGYVDIYIYDPLIIAPTTNIAGYGIALDGATNVHLIGKPRFIGYFTNQLVFGGALPGIDKRAQCTVSPGFDNTTGGINGTVQSYWEPVRFPVISQSTEPTALTNTFRNELLPWKNTNNNQYTLIFTPMDGSGQKYIDMAPKPTRRGTKDLTGGSVTINANTVETSTVTITGVRLGDVVAISASVALDANLIKDAQVTADDTVTYSIANPTLANKTRAATYLFFVVTPRDFT